MTPTEHLTSAIVWEIELSKALGKNLSDHEAIALALAADLRQPNGPYCEGANSNEAIKRAREIVQQ